MIPPKIARRIIDDFLNNYWHIILVSEAKVSERFGNNIFLLDEHGFVVHEVFRTDGEFDGTKYYYNEMTPEKLELLARLIPEFREVCMRIKRKCHQK